MNVTLDVGHFILAALSGAVVFFLQRELRRADDLRRETLELVKGANDKLSGHESRLNRHGKSIAVMRNDLDHIYNKVGEPIAPRNEGEDAA